MLWSIAGQAMIDKAYSSASARYLDHCHQELSYIPGHSLHTHTRGQQSPLCPSIGGSGLFVINAVERFTQSEQFVTSFPPTRSKRNTPHLKGDDCWESYLSKTQLMLPNSIPSQIVVMYDPIYLDLSKATVSCPAILAYRYYTG